MKTQISGKSINIITSSGNSYDFKFISKIMPQKNDDVIIRETVFQSDSDSEKNRHGNGPFCSFNIDLGSISEGVYIFCLDNEIQYIGESKDLNRQFNDGFGRIEEINTTTRGRSTNCKLNHAILAEAKKGKFFNLFVFETKEHKKVKKEILEGFFETYNRKPKYNGRS